ncbi:MAG: extracellular solute-binding protein [Phycisphaerales bacterium]|nr:extracellular solute-binding protein [Phycisphaerales bacterium]
MARTAREWAFGIGAVVVLLAAIVFAILAMSGRWDRAANKLPPPRTVVLYTSVDDPIAREIADRFRVEFGIIVEMVGDTEATKTTGLIQRLLAEKDNPRADVWWSSEPLGTVLLAKQGLLQPIESPPLDPANGTPWPAEFRAADGSWHAFAQRARVIAYNSRWIKSTDAPTTLRQLTAPALKGKVGIARPQFGTTRAHMAALAAMHGPVEFRRWLEALKANEVKLYDGNSAVARGLSMGEIDVGLTDTDDVWSAQLNAWPVAMHYEANESKVADGAGGRGEEAPGGASARTELPSLGAIVIPNTVAVLKGCPNPREARLLAEFLMSQQTEAMLAKTEQRTVPIRTYLMSDNERKAYVVPTPASVDWDRVAEALPEAMKICEEVLGD